MVNKILRQRHSSLGQEASL